jgi:hypothetical protein
MVKRLRDEENVLFGSLVKIMKCSCCLLSSLAVNLEGLTTRQSLHVAWLKIIFLLIGK